MSRLENALIALDAIVTVIYTILLVVEHLPPSTGFQLTIPPELSWGVLIILLVAISITIAVRYRQRSYFERGEGIMAFIFFPKGTPEENKTLEYHEKHFHKKLIVNFKRKPPQAYYLPTANTSYGWKLIHKYTDMWVSEEDTIYPDTDTEKWCEKRGYKLNPRSATKYELSKFDTRGGGDLINKLGGRTLDDVQIVFIYPWYSFSVHFLEKRIFPPSKRLLLKFSTKQAFEPPLYHMELIENEVLYTQSCTLFPLESLRGWCKRHGYTFNRRHYTEKELIGEQR